MREKPVLIVNGNSSVSVLYFLLKCKAVNEATVSGKNQIVIPREAREALHVKPGDKLLIVIRGERVIVLKKPVAHHTAIRGLGRGTYPATHVRKERQSWD